PAGCWPPTAAISTSTTAIAGDAHRSKGDRENNRPAQKRWSPARGAYHPDQLLDPGARHQREAPYVPHGEYARDRAANRWPERAPSRPHRPHYLRKPATRPLQEHAHGRRLLDK